MRGHVERIEQAGNCITITTGGLAGHALRRHALRTVSMTRPASVAAESGAARWKNGVHSPPWNTVVASPAASTREWRHDLALRPPDQRLDG